jgi:hypothetical protein
LTALLQEMFKNAREENNYKENTYERTTLQWKHESRRGNARKLFPDTQPHLLSGLIVTSKQGKYAKICNQACTAEVTRRKEEILQVAQSYKRMHKIK